jgi:hypothetical protein
MDGAGFIFGQTNLHHIYLSTTYLFSTLNFYLLPPAIHEASFSLKLTRIIVTIVNQVKKNISLQHDLWNKLSYPTDTG